MKFSFLPCFQFVAALFAALVPLSHAQSIPTNGLVAYYPFNGNANDESGNGHHGVMTGGTIVGDRFGNPGRALNLNGQGDFVTVANSESLNLTNDLTLTAWIRIQDLPLFRQAYTLFAKRLPGGGFNDIPYLFAINYQFGIPSDYSQLLFVTAHGAGTYQYLGSAGGIVPGNQWVHLVLVIETNRLKLFLGGVKVAEQPITPGSRFGNQAPLLIGSGARTDIPAEFFKGQLDDLRIYNRALSEIEIAQLVSSELTVPTITANPTNQAVLAGRNASFAVSGTGPEPLTYRWLKNATNSVPGGTNSNLVIISAQVTDLGGYSAVVTGTGGSITSSVAQLFIIRPAMIQPTVVNGFVVGGVVVDGGYGYTNTPAIVFEGGSGTGATGTVVVVNGAVVGVNMIAAGSGYGVEPPVLLVESPVPNLAQLLLSKAVKPVFHELLPGASYQLQVSDDLIIWRSTGSPFTATNTAMIYPQYWDVENWNKLNFRLLSYP